MRESADQVVEAQPPQVVGYLSGDVGAAVQLGDQDVHVLVGEAGRGEQRLAQGVGPAAWPAQPLGVARSEY